MDIYFLDTDNFSEKILDDFIKNCAEDVSFNDDLKKKQHFAGRYLLHYILEKEYGIKDFETEIKNGKPFLKNLPYYYSISHSKNLVGLAIGDKPVGFDIEFNKTERDFEKISKRYEKEIKTKKEFYEFWTKHEAKIKLGSEKKDIFYTTGTINDDFAYSAACEEPFYIYNFSTINM